MDAGLEHDAAQGEPLLDPRQALGRVREGCRGASIRRRVPPVARPRPRASELGAFFRPARAFGEQAGAVGGFQDPAADLADAGRRPRQAAADPVDVGERAAFPR